MKIAIAIAACLISTAVAANDQTDELANRITDGIQRTLDYQSDPNNPDCKNDGSCVMAIGRCAAASMTHVRRGIAIGDYTRLPEGSSGFVNIGNKICFWRDTKQWADCPPPELECMP